MGETGPGELHPCMKLLSPVTQKELPTYMTSQNRITSCCFPLFLVVTEQVKPGPGELSHLMFCLPVSLISCYSTLIGSDILIICERVC